MDGEELFALASIVFDTEFGPKLAAIAPSNPLNAEELRAVVFAAVPDLRVAAQSTSDAVIQSSHFFRVRRTSAIPYGSSPLKEQSFLFGVAAFRQVAAPGMPRGVAQRALALVVSWSLLENPGFMACILEILLNNFFENLDVNSLHAEVHALATGTSRSFREINFRAEEFKHEFPAFLGRALFPLWEMLATADYAVGVFCAGDAAHVSSLVLNLLQIIRPLQYAGDLRPYISFYEADVPAFTRTRSPRIIGLTNAALLEQLLPTTDAVLVFGNFQLPPDFVSVASAERFPFAFFVKRKFVPGEFQFPGRSSSRRLLLPVDEAVVGLESSEILSSFFRSLSEWALSADDRTRPFPGSVKPSSRKLEKLRSRVRNSISS